MGQHKVGIIMGSDSDFGVMKEAITVLDKQEIEYEVRIISAHRTPEEMLKYAKEAKERGYGIIIAGAGGAAHLPGMTASMCSLPVIGVPVRSRSMEGIDSVLSILQMPAGIPVATVGVNNAKGAAKLAARMLRSYDTIESAEKKGQQLQQTIKIVFDEKDASKEDLEKVIETVGFYGIEYEVIDIGGTDYSDSGIQKWLQMAEEEGATAVLNLADSEIKKLETLTKLPVLTVPTKSSVCHSLDEFERATQTVGEVCKMSNEMNEASSSIAMLAVNGYQNAGIMLARMAGIHSTVVYNRVANQLEQLREQVIKKDADMSAKFPSKA